MSGHTVTAYSSALTLCSFHSLMSELGSVENAGREENRIGVYNEILILNYTGVLLLSSPLLVDLSEINSLGNLLTSKKWSIWWPPLEIVQLSKSQNQLQEEDFHEASVREHLPTRYFVLFLPVRSCVYNNFNSCLELFS